MLAPVFCQTLTEENSSKVESNQICGATAWIQASLKEKGLQLHATLSRQPIHQPVQRSQQLVGDLHIFR
jgi:hypothetical protein